VRLQRIDNKDYIFGEVRNYWYSELEEDGLDHPLLFCPSEIKAARRRALRKPSTRPTQWWHRLLPNHRNKKDE